LLCVLPLLLLCALGVLSVATTKGKYVAQSIMYVENDTLLQRLTGAGATTNNGYQTPAQSANDRLNSLIGTDGFLRTVADKAKLTDAVNGGLISLAQIRSSIGSGPSSANTLKIGVAYDDPTVAFNLATAMVPAFVDWVVSSSLSESETAIEFLQARADEYNKALADARAAQSAYVAKFPDPASNGTRPSDQVAALAQLDAAVKDALDRYTATVGQLEAARLASAQARSNVEGRLRLVDSPKFPSTTTGSLKSKVMQFGLFFVLGAMLSTAAVFITTLADKTIRFGGEVRDDLGVPLLAIIPDSPASQIRLAKGTTNA
jgi:capsular polysaccharide biosynthesis protein